jgi:hypothetical protein
MTGFKSKRAAALDEEGMYLVHHTAQELTLQEQLDIAKAERDNKKERLIRIMGTFDLATGHADTWDDLLDSLESELRDVLGHYRAALAQPAQEPVAWWCGTYSLPAFGFEKDAVGIGSRGIPLYTAPPQRLWVGLTSKDLNEIFAVARTGEHAVNLAADKLKEKNNG